MLNDEENEEETETFQTDLTDISDNASEKDINRFLDDLLNHGIGRAELKNPKNLKQD